MALSVISRLQPADVQGFIRPNVVEDWLEDLEKIFEIMQCTEEEKYRLAIFTLQGDAHIWWKSV